MRAILAVGLLAGVVALSSACGGSPTNPMSSTSMTGAWAGTSSDSTGSMMGAGLTGNMMADTNWQIVQSGTNFTGTMRFGGYSGGTMLVTGTMVGRTGTFTMTMPAGSMMMSGSCTATATGTFDMDDMETLMQGIYTGSNTCMGSFDHGQVRLTRK